ncbi:VanZ family protein [Levilactobacillus suantsaiihabitans]|uniref:VanZ family protein n=1 Tax=Levilactobacillus suantsaiihabitans TaxID=2487722 RepID=A0A4Z0J7S0_9LACO|nr:VanZ family protein [Levilactobacillus suantsaiihabitans]TGD18106.1 VanZ family protein [Levilactobacillus suantsaiihabitans]
MIRWIPAVLVSLIWLGLSLRAARARQYWRLLWWLGCWGLSLLTWTPIAFSFGSDSVSVITTHWIAGGIWVLQPLGRGSVDASFWCNILMTVPQGCLLRLNWPRLRWPHWLLAGLATGLSLETGQALGNWLVSLGRWVDINDVITNCTGIVIGAALATLGQHYWSKKFEGD